MTWRVPSALTPLLRERTDSRAAESKNAAPRVPKVRRKRLLTSGHTLSLTETGQEQSPPWVLIWGGALSPRELSLLREAGWGGGGTAGLRLPETREGL